MENKTILFVTQFFYPDNISTGLLPYELSQQFSRDYYNVKVVTGYPKEYFDSTDLVKKHEIDKDGIEITRIKYPIFNKNSKIGRITNYFVFCFLLIFKLKHFKDVDYCITYTNPIFLPFMIAVIKKIYRFKMILVMYDLYPDAAIKAGVLKDNSAISKLFDKANRYALKCSDAIVALSEECRQYIAKYKRIDNEKIYNIPNWYKKQKININDHSKLNIIYGGNMGVMQDMETIKNIILKLKNRDDIQFTICGHGNKKHEIENFILNNHISNCTIYGMLQKEDYDKLLDEMDLAFVSLEKFAHGLGSPSKAYSYLSKGLPLIVIMDPDSELYKDINEFNCGICVNADIDNAVNKILSLAKTKNKLYDYKENAVTLFERKYTLQAAYVKYKSVIKSIY